MNTDRMMEIIICLTKNFGKDALIKYLIIAVVIGYIIYKICTSIKSKSIARKITNTEEVVLQYITTFNNPSISGEDVATMFALRAKTFLHDVALDYDYDKGHRGFYLVSYSVYNESEKQNFAWTFEAKKYIYEWGTIYESILCFSNGWFSIKACENSFLSGGKEAIKLFAVQEGTVGYYDVLDHIRVQVDSCLKESELMWKTHNRTISGNQYPFPRYLFPN